MTNIAKDSQHLDGYLKRLLKKGAISSRDYQLIESIFLLSLENGGRLELDFLRDEEVSFNPRPARIAIILIKDEKIYSAKVIAAAILSTAMDNTIAAESSPSQLLNLDIPEPIINLAKDSLRPANLIQTKEAALIACAKELDRARHLHQTSNANKELFWHKFLEKNQNYIRLAEIHSSGLYTLLSAWQKRFRKQFL